METTQPLILLPDTWARQASAPWPYSGPAPAAPLSLGQGTHTAARESADVISLLEILKNLQTLAPGLKPRARLLILTVFLLFPCIEMILHQKTIVQCTQNTAIHRLHFVTGKKNRTFTL